MNVDEFFTRVRELTALESTDEARMAIEATLRVLGSRLPDAETFLECVHEREAEADRIDPDGAGTHVRAVALVLDEVVTDDTLSGARAQLSDGYDRLFDPTRIEEP